MQVAGETIEFVVDNTAGFDHNFYIGPADVLQTSFAETEVGIPTWQSGVQELTWTVPAEKARSWIADYEKRLAALEKK